MNLNIEKLPQYTLLKVMDSELDTSVAPYLKAKLVAIAGGGAKNIVLDLSKCQYCDSSGLSAILVANRLCRNAEGTSVLTGLTKTVEHQLRLSRLDAMLNIAKSKGDVDAFFKNM